MVRKIGCVLLIFFLIAMPAFADSTTGSEYDIMPFVLSDGQGRLMRATGPIGSDSFSSASYSPYFSLNSSFNDLVRFYGGTSNNSDQSFANSVSSSSNPYLVLGFESSGLSAPQGSIRFFIPLLEVSARIAGSSIPDNYWSYDVTRYQPLYSFARVSYSYTLITTNIESGRQSFVGYTGSKSIPISNPISNPTFFPLNFSSGYGHRLFFDFDVSIPVSGDDFVSLPADTSTSSYSYQGFSVTAVSFYTYLPLNSGCFTTRDVSTGEILICPKNLSFTTFGQYSQPPSPSVSRFNVFYNTVSSSVGSSNNLGGSISNLQSSMQSNFSQLQQAIAQGSQQVKDAIDQQTGQLQQATQQQTSQLQQSMQQQTDDIVGAVDDLKEETKSGFEKVVDGITGLPGKIWEVFEEGLTKLLVPDGDEMAGQFSAFQDLLKSKLGFLYEVPEMMVSLFESITSGITNPQTTMTFPAFSLPWIDGSDLQIWPEIEFDIIPKGLEILSDLIKTVTSIVMVSAAFNSIKAAFERFLGVGESG